MTETSRCIDRGDLVAYLYGEVDHDTRRQFDAHLRRCPICAEEIRGLEGVRASLDSWNPPDAQLGFRMVTTTRRKGEGGWLLGRVMSPQTWGIAAVIALLVLTAAAITRPEIEFGPDRMVLRIRWPQWFAQNSAVPSSSPTQTNGESMLAPDWPAVNRAWLQRVNELIRESEQRQVRVLSDRVREIELRIEEQRQADLSEMERTFREVDPNDAALARQQLLEYMSRISAQR